MSRTYAVERITGKVFSSPPRRTGVIRTTYYFPQPGGAV